MARSTMKTGTRNYNVLSLSDDQRLNIVPAKGLTWTRVEVKHMITDPHALGWGTQQEGTEDHHCEPGEHKYHKAPAQAAAAGAREGNASSGKTGEGGKIQAKSHSVIQPMGAAAKCPSLGLLRKAKVKLPSAAFPGCGAVKLPKAQDGEGTANPLEARGRKETQSSQQVGWTDK